MRVMKLEIQMRSESKGDQAFERLASHNQVRCELVSPKQVSGKFGYAPFLTSPVLIIHGEAKAVKAAAKLVAAINNQ